MYLTFDDQYIQYEGCNTHRIPYTAYTDNLFTILSSTWESIIRRNCTVDNDKNYTDLLSKINRFKKS